MLKAFWRVAPSVRLSFLAICDAVVFLRAMVFRSRTSPAVHERRFFFLLAIMPPFQESRLVSITDVKEKPKDGDHLCESRPTATYAIMELEARVRLQTRRGELTNAFVRSFLARRSSGCKSNFRKSALLFKDVGREMTISTRIALLLLLAVACSSFAAAPRLAARTPELSCSGAQRPRQVAELLFGRDIGRRLGVSESAWSNFVANELTPRFPDGLTITDAVGQWRDAASGQIVREPAKKVEIVLPGNGGDQARLDAAVKAYKSKFHQRSVGVIVRPA
ncbi:MAG: DUF3574 domain-containing protein, partial [Xanthobacteraceae bacterium]